MAGDLVKRVKEEIIDVKGYPKDPMGILVFKYYNNNL